MGRVRCTDLVGLIVKYGSKVVVVTAESIGAAEHVALELLASAGIQALGEEVTMVVFTPDAVGGLIVETASQSMDGWTTDGFVPPESPE